MRLSKATCMIVFITEYNVCRAFNECRRITVRLHGKNLAVVQDANASSPEPEVHYSAVAARLLAAAARL